MTFILGFIAGALTGAGFTFCAVEILRLRRELKAAHSALQAQSTGYASGVAPMKEQEIGRPERPEPPPPQFSGVGPSAIADRERYEKTKQQRDTTPPFASPTMSEIREASRRAVNGGNGDR